MKRFVLFIALVLSLFQAIAPAHAAPLPDLVLSGVEHKVATNGQEYLQITIKNAGTANAGGFSIKIYGTGGSNTNQLIFQPSGLAAGASKTLLHYPGFIPTCDFVRTIIVDAAKSIVEKNETYNSKMVEDAFCPRPDLQVSVANVGTDPLSPSFYHRVTVKNVGGAAAGAFAVKVETVNANNLGTTKQIAGLAPGASYTFSFYPFYKGVCDQRLRAIADPTNVINELDEIHNTGLFQYECPQ